MMKKQVGRFFSLFLAAGMVCTMGFSLAAGAEEESEEMLSDAGIEAEDREPGENAGGPTGSSSVITEEDLAVPMQNGPYSLDLSDYADQWTYVDHVDLLERGTPTGESVDIDGAYVLKDVVYCTNPVDATEECLSIFVPAAYMQDNGDGTFSVNPEGSVSGVTVTGQEYTYTAETAPIYFINGVDAYRSAQSVSNLGEPIKAQSEFHNYDYTNSGFVMVSPSCRGGDSDPANDGTIPAGIIDLKAAVRFIKYNDDVLAGDSDRIISVGGSAGGGMSALLGSSGNSPDYEEDLEAIGAADATDDVYAAMCYCPITDLDHADELYEFLHYGEKYVAGYEGFGSDLKRSDNPEYFDEDTLAVQTILYDNGIAYVQSLGLDRDLGDDGRSGAYYEDYLNAFETSMAGYLAMTFDSAEEVQAYIDETVDPDGTGYVTYDPETGEVTISSIDDLTANYEAIQRAKGTPGFDAVDVSSEENAAFGTIDEDGNSIGSHFSVYTAQAFQEAGMDDIYEEYMAEIDDEMLDRVYRINPMNYIADENSDNAPYWRFCSGSADGDLSSVSSWLLTNMLETYGDVTDVEYVITWDKQHGTADYHITDQVAWVVSITAD